MRPFSTRQQPAARWFYAQALTMLLLAGCGASRGFVDARPIRFPSAERYQPGTTGYLQLEVTTNLDAISSQSAYRLDKKISYLSVSIESPTAEGQVPDLPVALYDIRGRRQVALTALDVGRRQFVNLESGSEPRVTIHIRAIPQSVSAPFLRAVQALDRIAGMQLGAGSLGTGQVKFATNAATSIISAFADEAAVGQPWHVEQVFGLNGQGALPLGGSVVLLLVPGGDSRPIPTVDEIQLCEGDQGRLCKDNVPYTEFAYIVLSPSLENYRPLSDWAPEMDCTRVTSDMPAIEEAIRRAPLTRQQREAERSLYQRLDLYVSVASGALGDVSKAADLAYQFVQLPNPNDDQTLTERARPVAQQMVSCLNGTIPSLGIDHAERWRHFVTAFERVDSWQKEESEAAADSRQEILERALRDIATPIKTFKLDNGSAYGLLRSHQDRIEQHLLVYDNKLISEVHAAVQAAVLRELSDSVSKRIQTTHCESCRQVLTVGAQQVAVRLADAQNRDAEQAAREASARSELLAAIHDAAETNDVASIQLTSESLEGLRNNLATATELSFESSDTSQLISSAEDLRMVIEGVRTELSSTTTVEGN